MNALARRLHRLEDRMAQRIAARPALNAKQILCARIESMAARLKAAGYSFPESGPEADAARLLVQQGLARLIESG